MSRYVSAGRIARSATVALALAGLLSIAPARGEDVKPGPDGVVEIGIDNFAFTPQEVTVAAGTTVRWVNHDDIPHVVAEVGQNWHSGPLDTDDKYEVKLDKPGAIDYFCTLHPHMTGKIIVK